jgi:hypothetical protein
MSFDPLDRDPIVVPFEGRVRQRVAPDNRRLLVGDPEGEAEMLAGPEHGKGSPIVRPELEGGDAVGLVDTPLDDKLADPVPSLLDPRPLGAGGVEMDPRLLTEEIEGETLSAEGSGPAEGGKHEHGQRLRDGRGHDDHAGELTEAQHQKLT